MDAVEFCQAVGLELPEGVEKPSDIQWDHPVLVFMAEHGRIPKVDTPGLLVPKDTREPQFMIEFFCYVTWGCTDHYLR